MPDNKTLYVLIHRFKVDKPDIIVKEPVTYSYSKEKLEQYIELMYALRINFENKMRKINLDIKLRLLKKFNYDSGFLSLLESNSEARKEYKKLLKDGKKKLLSEYPFKVPEMKSYSYEFIVEKVDII